MPKRMHEPSPWQDRHGIPVQNTTSEPSVVSLSPHQTPSEQSMKRIAMSAKERLYSLIDSTKLGRAALEARRSYRHYRIPAQQIKSCGFTFVDRQKGSENLCIILAGYKEPLWDEVFKRIALFAPEDIDICIMTSGLRNESLMAVAEEHGWSYLATEINHLSHIQNKAIELHPQAQWIYKLDEDMFIPQGFFEALRQTYDTVEKNSPYVPAFVSPLINVNCFGYVRLLEKCDLLDDFRATGLAPAKVTDGLHHNQVVLEDPAIAKYLWGATQPKLRDIDALTAEFSSEPLAYSICPVRFSIGAILFTREAWKLFEGFPITFVGSKFGLGDDEEHICHFAHFTGRVIVVCENIAVGHLGYGPQTKAMLDYYLEHKDRFALSPANDER
jgi:hypothetical protein